MFKNLVRTDLSAPPCRIFTRMVLRQSLILSAAPTTVSPLTELQFLLSQSNEQLLILEMAVHSCSETDHTNGYITPPFLILSGKFWNSVANWSITILPRPFQVIIIHQSCYCSTYYSRILLTSINNKLTLMYAYKGKPN